MIAPAALIAQARQWLGVRFLHQGRTRLGCDCMGFIAGALAELNARTALALLPVNYGREPQALLIDTLTRCCQPIALQPGALVLIQWPQTADPSHAAIYTGSSLLHCYEAVGEVIEHGYRPPWTTRTASVWSLPEVQHE